MSKKLKEEADVLLTLVKSELKGSPFKTVFKATLGFYAAQFVATMAGLIVIGGILTSIALVVAVLKGGL